MADSEGSPERTGTGVEPLTPRDLWRDRSLGPWPGTGPRRQTRHILDLRALRADGSRLGQCSTPTRDGGRRDGLRPERISWCTRSQGIHIRPLVHRRLRQLGMAPHLIQCRGQRHFGYPSPSRLYFGPAPQRAPPTKNAPNAGNAWREISGLQMVPDFTDPRLDHPALVSSRSNFRLRSYRD